MYAVRQGPILAANIKALAVGRRDQLQAYTPQRHFLSLLMLGDARAIGTKFGITFTGRWVWNLKDHIDVTWMKRFAVQGKGGDAHESPEQRTKTPEPMQACCCVVLCCVVLCCVVLCETLSYTHSVTHILSYRPRRHSRWRVRRTFAYSCAHWRRWERTMITAARWWRRPQNSVCMCANGLKERQIVNL